METELRKKSGKSAEMFTTNCKFRILEHFKTIKIVLKCSKIRKIINNISQRALFDFILSKLFNGLLKWIWHDL